MDGRYFWADRLMFRFYLLFLIERLSCRCWLYDYSGILSVLECYDCFYGFTVGYALVTTSYFYLSLLVLLGLLGILVLWLLLLYERLVLSTETWLVLLIALVLSTRWVCFSTYWLFGWLALYFRNVFYLISSWLRFYSKINFCYRPFIPWWVLLY